MADQIGSQSAKTNLLLLNFQLDSLKLSFSFDLQNLLALPVQLTMENQKPKNEGKGRPRKLQSNNEAPEQLKIFSNNSSALIIANMVYFDRVLRLIGNRIRSNFGFLTYDHKEDLREERENQLKRLSERLQFFTRNLVQVAPSFILKQLVDIMLETTKCLEEGDEKDKIVTKIQERYESQLCNLRFANQSQLNKIKIDWESIQSKRSEIENEFKTFLSHVVDITICQLSNRESRLLTTLPQEIKNNEAPKRKRSACQAENLQKEDGKKKKVKKEQ